MEVAFFILSEVKEHVANICSKYNVSFKVTLPFYSSAKNERAFLSNSNCLPRGAVSSRPWSS